MANLAEGLQEEIKRNIELLGVYKSIGVPGQFGAMMIQRDIDAAVAAAISGDVVEMIHIYQVLKNNQ